MNNENNSGEGRLKKLLSSLWGLWPSLVDRLPDWIFAPKAELPPEPPDSTAPGLEIELYERFIDHRKGFHDETSKTIRRVFYTLLATCLFCVITLAGSPDAQLLTSDATVKLPVLNYDVGFQAFLVVGPVVLIALTIYLHIFVGQHRVLLMPSEFRQPILPNFNSWTAKLVVLVIFYWITPITLFLFAWKAWPHPFGKGLLYVAIFVTEGLIYLQFRRCPRGWRAWGLPLLFVLAIFSTYPLLLFSYEHFRIINLFKADLSDQDIRSSILSNVDLQEANLSGANLSEVDLSYANLSLANLSRANLMGVNLMGANLMGVNLSDANLSYAILSNFMPHANLSGANLSGAILSPSAVLTAANLSDTDLSRFDLSEANLYRANLSGANLSVANLSVANLSEANLSRADLSKANLPGANLSGAKIIQDQLEQACGDKDTSLPKGLSIKPCSNDQTDTDDRNLKQHKEPPSVPK